MIGETIGGDYTIVRQLGEGGMGVVYEARQASTGRRAAIKVITGDLVMNATVVERFQVEARAASAIDSEHVVEVLGSGYDQGRRAPFLAMELLAGTDLQALIEGAGRLPPDLALRIAAQACLGLEKAHARGIIHRDIKPANLFLSEREGGERRVKILDFGIAKIKMEDPEQAKRAKLTRTGTLIGSPLYMSPEQARSQSKIDHRSDLWSLGVVMYEALTGRAPLAALSDLGEIIVTLCTTPVPAIRTQAPWVSPAVAAAVERALIIDPGQRYQSAREMYAALVALLPQGTAIHASMLALPRAPEGQMTGPELAVATSGTVPGQPLPYAHTGPQSHAFPPPPHAAAKGGGGGMIAGVLGALVVAAACGFGGAFAMGWVGRSSTPAPTIALPEAPPTTTLQPVQGASLPAPLAALKGPWKSESGRLYEAVAVSDGLEFQIRDPNQFAGQAYLEREARFILREIPGEAGAFQVEDRIRPVPPKGTTYDVDRARASCVQAWSAIGGKALRAEMKGDRLIVKMARLEVPSGMFQQEGTRVVGCAALGGAKVSEVESALTKL